MTYSLTTTGIEADGVNYAFTRPDGFDTWLKTKQDAFVAGVLHVYRGFAATPAPTTIPSEEILL